MEQRSFYEDSGYKPLEEGDGAVQRWTVRGRSRAAPVFTLSLADKGEKYGAWSEERRRKTSSLYGTIPRRAGVGFSTRNGSQYGTLPRRARKQTPPLPNFAPLDRRPAESKVVLMKDAPKAKTLSSIKRQKSPRGSLRKNKAIKI